MSKITDIRLRIVITAPSDLYPIKIISYTDKEFLRVQHLLGNPFVEGYDSHFREGYSTHIYNYDNAVKKILPFSILPGMTGKLWRVTNCSEKEGRCEYMSLDNSLIAMCEIITCQGVRLDSDMEPIPSMPKETKSYRYEDEDGKIHTGIIFEKDGVICMKASKKN